jgi:tetratricopeptide (TPR) repeat protein
MNIIPIENIMAERYLYIPLVGFCIQVAFLLNKISTRDIKKKALNFCGFILMISLIVIGFSWQTCHISKIWFNELSFLSIAAKKSPQSARAHNNLGVLYKKMGFIDAAVREYTTAIQIKSDYSEAHSNLANAYIDKGYFENAITEYKRSIEISPFNETAHFNLGVAYGKMGLSRNAEMEYENVIRINNNNPHAHNNLGNIYEDRNFLEKAMAEYKLSLSIDQENAIAHNNMGNVFCKKGSIDEAILEYSAAAENDPTRIIYHENLGNTYLKKGLIEEAIAEFEAILAIDLGNAASYLNLVMLYWRHKKDSEKACFYLRKLSDLEPDQKEAISKMIEKLQTKK